MKSRFYLPSLAIVVAALLATIGFYRNEFVDASQDSATQLLSTRDRLLGCADSEVFRTSDMACYTPQGE